MNASRGASSLARQAEKFLYEDSLPSSDSSMELHRSLSPDYKHHNKSTTRRYVDTTSDNNLNKTRDTTPRLNQTALSKRSPPRRLKSPDISSSRLDISRNKSFGRKSVVNTSRVDEMVKPKSCQQEKYLLRTKIHDLEAVLDKQNKKVKKLYERVLSKREETKDLTDQLFESKKKNLVVMDLKEKIKGLESNEMSLVNELNEQQKLARSTLNQFYELQEECAVEVERTKKQGQDEMNRRLREQEELWDSKLKRLEEENWKLMSKVREMETMEEIEKKRRNIAVSSEVATLKSQLSDKALENDRLRDEVRELRHALSESERMAAAELRTLRNSIDILTEQNRTLKSQEDDVVSREMLEKNQLRRRVEALQDELEQGGRTLREKDAGYKEQLEVISRKMANLQVELKKLNEYEEKVDELQKALDIKENELELTKKYYKEKLESKRVSQEQQKKEWSGIYSELLGEIKMLKGEIDNLGGENKKLLTSLRAKDRREQF